MYFLIDKEKKVVFGWSPKCGCTHLKTIFYFLTERDSTKTFHTPHEMKAFPKDISNYTTIIVIRNPYKRLVSGFLDKYKSGGQFRLRWKNESTTFSTFVDELTQGNWGQIDRHHFNRQTSNYFDKKILTSKVFKCYDIENIDYTFIESLYGKQIPNEVLTKSYGHERKKGISSAEEPVFDLDMSVYYDKNVAYSYFYNGEIKDKVYEFYKKDFEFFNEIGFHYRL